MPRPSFFSSIAAGAAANIIVTSGLNLGVTPPIQRQATAFATAAAVYLYGVINQDSAAMGFSIGMGGMAAIQCLMHMSGQTNQSPAQVSTAIHDEANEARYEL